MALLYKMFADKRVRLCGALLQVRSQVRWYSIEQMKLYLPTSVWLIDVDVMDFFGAGRREACHRLGPVWEGGVDWGDSGTTPCTTTCKEEQFP